MTSRQAINYSKDQHEQILLSLNAEELRRSYQEKLNQIVSNSPPPQSPEMSDSGFAEGHTHCLNLYLNGKRPGVAYDCNFSSFCT